jgi:hypothetical protein
MKIAQHNPWIYERVKFHSSNMETYSKLAWDKEHSCYKRRKLVFLENFVSSGVSLDGTIHV